MNKYVKFSLIGVIVIVALAAIVDVTNLIFNEESSEVGSSSQYLGPSDEEAKNNAIKLHFNNNGHAEWRGDITNETTYFTVKLKKGQTVEVDADVMYSWNLLSPSGQEIGCGDDIRYCIAGPAAALSLEGEEVEVATAPVDGDYMIEATYRVCGLETGCNPINDTITFIVR